MEKQSRETKQIAMYGLSIALAFILSYLETILPMPIMMPGMKLGLTNLVVMVVLYHMGECSAFAVNIVRILLVSLTFGNMMTLWYSVAGGVLSFLVMVILKRTKMFSVISVSVAGSIAHNAGQILVAMFVLQTTMVYWYFGMLCISGVIAGSIIGYLTGLVLEKIPKIII